MRTEGADDLFRLRRHLDLPRPLRGFHLHWLRKRNPSAYRALRELLDAANRDDGGIVDKRIDALLAASRHEQSPVSDLAPGDRLGPWRIGELLAHGGMGSVYIAHRDDGAYQQTVAIKRIRADRDSGIATDIFLREREILARLSYPGICRLIDGGVDGNGMPWLAMELIKGSRIDCWSDAKRLTIQERIELFLQACDAVDHAHRQGVLHGDIKPGNLLVDTSGRVVLVDFGVSVLVDRAEGASFAGVTQPYAAPESIARNAADIGSDIFAMGAVLCLLLLGAPPSDTPGASIIEMLSQDRDSAFDRERMLRAATSADLSARQLPHRRALARIVRSDLGAILEKCLRYRPQRRYSSASELGRDLRRWLRSQPVSAAAGGCVYRATKMIARHRVVATLGVFMLVSITVIQLQAWSKQRATEANLVHVHRMLEDALGVAATPGFGGDTLNPRSLLALTESRLRASRKRLDEDAFAHGLLTLARSYIAVGDYQDALRLVTDARRHGRDSRFARTESDTVRAAILNRQARYREAENVAIAALRDRGVLSAMFDDAPATTELTMELARARWYQGRHDEAHVLIDEAIAWISSHSADAAALPDLLVLRAEWRTDLYRTSSAKEDLDLAIRISEGSAPRTADRARLTMVRTLLRMNRQDDAYALASRTLMSYERTYGPRHPESGRAMLACIEASLHRVSMVREHVETNREYARRAMAIFRDTLGTGHPLYTESLKYTAYMRALTRDGEPREIIAQARDSLALLRRAPGATPKQHISSKVLLADMLSEFSIELRDDELLREALALYEEVAMQTERERIPIPHVLSVYARALQDVGDIARAKQALLRANQETKRYLGEDNPLLVFNHLLLAGIETAAGDDAAAESALDIALRSTAERRQNAKLLRSAVLDAYLLRSEIRERRGDKAGAIAAIAAARDDWSRSGGDPQDARVRDIERRMRNVACLEPPQATGRAGIAGAGCPLDTRTHTTSRSSSPSSLSTPHDHADFE